MDLTKCYKLINASPEDSLKDIKRKYRKLLLNYHPDLNKENKEKAQEITRQIINAYELIIKSIDATKKFKTEEKKPACDDLNLLTFQISGREFGIKVSLIDEVIRLKDLTIEEVSIIYKDIPFVWAIGKKEDKIIVMWNLQKQLNLKETPIFSDFENNYVIIVNSDDMKIGFLIENIIGVMRFHPENIIFNSSTDIKIIKNFVKTKDKEIGIIECENLLAI